MTAADLTPEPASQETLALLRLEQAVSECTELLKKSITTQAQLEARVDQWIGPTMDVAATLHGIGEIVAKLLAASVTHGKAIAALSGEVRELARTSDSVLDLSVFDHDPVRRLVQV